MKVVVNGLDMGNVSDIVSWNELVVMAVLKRKPKVLVALNQVKNTEDEDAPNDDDFEPLRPNQGRSISSGTLHARVTFDEE